MTVLSVDVASRRYRDNGIALLRRSRRGIEAELLAADSLGLSGVPDAECFARVLDQIAQRRHARLILLDGPQGWRADASPLVHQRGCERATCTPGKTGLPRTVKPRTWTRMAEFSIALFDALAARGWPRLTSGWAGERAAIESFPTHGWRSMGFRALSGKAACRADLSPWTTFLTSRHRVRWRAAPTHDQLQAVVAGIGGLQLIAGGPATCDIQGENPRLESGFWREGFIVSPI